MENLLSVQNLSVKIHKGKKTFTAVDKISFYLHPGEITGIVGESGCGKTLTALSIAKLLPESVEASGEVLFSSSGERESLNMLSLDEDDLCAIRGKEISFVFQEPFSSLNPLLKVGNQITESLEIHGEKNRIQNRKLVIDLMKKLGLSGPEKLFETYPSQLSGGMCQRVMIALSMICKPRLLIADEPTTALDVNTQDQILDLLVRINREEGTSVLFISHDLGLVKRLCSRVMVMYAGRIIETGTVEEVFSAPAHEYTKGLLGCLPERNRKGEKLCAIPGKVPAVEEERSPGCAFAPRCSKAKETCKQEPLNEIVLSESRRTFCIRGNE